MIYFALIGCGKIAEKYCQIFNSIQEAKVTRVFDIKKTKAKKIYYLLENKPLIANNLEKALEKVDAILIATPPANHFELIKKAAAKRINIFVEKPIALNYPQTKKAISFCKRNKVILRVDFQYRQAPLLDLIKKYIKSNNLGKIIFVKININWLRDKQYYSGWRNNMQMAGGGILISQLIHFIDFATQIFGKPSYVSCINKNGILAKKVEDTSVSILSYDNGPEIIITGSNCVYPDSNDEISIEGTKGTIKTTQL